MEMGTEENENNSGQGDREAVIKARSSISESLLQHVLLVPNFKYFLLPGSTDDRKVFFTTFGKDIYSTINASGDIPTCSLLGFLHVIWSKERSCTLVTAM